MTPPAAAPHVLGIDDGPFDRLRDADTLVVGVVMSGAALVEGILSTRLAIDAAGATAALAEWIRASRFRPSLRAVLLDGITIAGLSVVDLPALARATGIPVIAVTRSEPESAALEEALRTAGLAERIALLKAAGPAHAFDSIAFRCHGATPDAARAILASQRGRSRMPESLRLAHLIAAGVAAGESRGS